MDLVNKLKIFGFPRAYLNYNYSNPIKIKNYVHKKHGYFEAPKFTKNRELGHLVNNYRQREEYEKYLNPKGFKPTITSNFPKIGSTIDHVNLKCHIVRTDKNYKGNFLKFLVDINMSKPEIKQYLEKLYNMEIKEIKTAILPGSVKLISGRGGRGQWIRTKDRKKVLVKLDFPFHSFYNKIDDKKNEPMD